MGFGRRYFALGISVGDYVHTRVIFQMGNRMHVRRANSPMCFWLSKMVSFSLQLRNQTLHPTDHARSAVVPFRRSLGIFPKVYIQHPRNGNGDIFAAIQAFARKQTSRLVPSKMQYFIAMPIPLQHHANAQICAKKSLFVTRLIHE